MCNLYAAYTCILTLFCVTYLYIFTHLCEIFTDFCVISHFCLCNFTHFCVISGPPGSLVSHWKPACRQARVGTGSKEVRAHITRSQNKGRSLCYDCNGERVAADAASTDVGQGEGKETSGTSARHV